MRLRANYADAYTAMGVSLKELGRKTEAQACFQVVARLRPGCALSLGNLAGIYYEQVPSQLCSRTVTRTHGAVIVWPLEVHMLRLSSSGDGPTDGLKCATAYCAACPVANSTCARVQGMLDDAIMTYKEAIAREPNFPEAYNNLVSLKIDIPSSLAWPTKRLCLVEGDNQAVRS